MSRWPAKTVLGGLTSDYTGSKCSWCFLKLTVLVKILPSGANGAESRVCTTPHCLMFTDITTLETWTPKK